MIGNLQSPPAVPSHPPDGGPRRARPRKTFRFPLRPLALLCFFATRTLPASGGETSDGEAPVRFAFTRAMFVDLNESDARAAVKSYARLLAANNDLTVSDSPELLDGAAAVADAFARGTVDIASLTTVEFLALPAGSTHPRLIAAAMGGSNTEQYVLLARKDSPYKKISDLKNRRLLVYSGLRGTLSPLWIDVLLATENCGPPGRFFGSIVPVNKPSRTVLPVFFGQADACVVTRNGFAVMCEMNPQISAQLTVLATSPAFVPTITCCRSGMPASSFERTMNAVLNAQHSVTGRQILTLFQCDSITEIRDDEIASVRELLVAQTRLRAEDQTSSPFASLEPVNPVQK